MACTQSVLAWRPSQSGRATPCNVGCGARPPDASYGYAATRSVRPSSPSAAHPDKGGEGGGNNHLRRLHREGKLSDEELERAESQMIRKVRAIADNSEAIRIRPKSDLPRDRIDPESVPEPEE